MTSALLDPLHPVRPARLEERLRASLRAARANPEIRTALVRLAGDPEHSDALRRTLGAGHALLRELRRLAAGGDHAPGDTRRGRSPSGGVAPTPQLRTPSTQS